MLIGGQKRMRDPKRLITMKIKISFIPVEDKPGYYWLNKRNCQIISEETLKKAIEDSNNNDKNKNQLFLSNSELHS